MVLHIQTLPCGLKDVSSWQMGTEVDIILITLLASVSLSSVSFCTFLYHS